MSLDNPSIEHLYSTRALSIILKYPDGERVEYKNLHIKVNIKKTISIEPNSATITIYNLSEYTRDRIFSATYDRSRGEPPIILSVMYEGSEIYQNVLINNHSMRDLSAGEWKTMFYCGDNPLMFSATVNNKESVPAGKTKGDAVKIYAEEFVEQFDEIKVNIEGFLSNDCLHNQTIFRAISKEGNFIDNFKKILKDCFPEEDFFIFFDDDELNILKGGDYLKGVDFNLDKDLVDPPSLTESGINLKILFNEEVQIAGKLLLDANNFELGASGLNKLQINKRHLSGEGEYQVMEVQHNIDNFSDKLATTDIVCRSLELVFNVPE